MSKTIFLWQNFVIIINFSNLSKRHFCRVYFMKSTLTGFICLCFAVCANAQPRGKAMSDGLIYPNENLTTLVPKKIYSQSVGQLYNSTAGQANPDFGTLPYNAPPKNVVEVLTKRTLDERYYIDIDEPEFFYIQKSAVPINYSKNGYLIAIDPTLQQTAAGVYEAPNQPHPTLLNTNLNKTNINCQNYFVDNNRYTLKVVSNTNAVTTYTADWTHYSVGNNGAFITDVFPGVDMQIYFFESRIKSNFVVKSAIPNCKKLIFTDQLAFSPGLMLVQRSGTVGQLFTDAIDIKDGAGTVQFTINRARTGDASGLKSNGVANPYRINGNNIELYVDSLYLSTPGLTYPLTVDPLITAVGPVAGTPNTIGSLASPAFCSQNITVTFPGGSTPWDFSASWVVGTIQCCSNGIGCFKSDAQLWLTSSCGGASPVGSPGTVWVCNTAGCFSSGNWGPTLPFASNGCQSMAQCYPASCTAQNMVFTININRTFCGNTFGCDCNWNNNICVYLNSWNVTLQGRTMETLGNTTTGNGSTTQAATCFGTVVMNPNALYGIAPLSYLWAPGGQTTPTKSFSPTAPGNNVFTCTITDACGTVRLATFTITNNCVLPIELTEYNAAYDGTYANIKWTTATEKNVAYFTLEHSLNGIDYRLVERVSGAGNSTVPQKYLVKHTNPNKNGVNYYRLKEFDIDGSEKLNKVITLDIAEEILEVNVIPNPSNGDLEIAMSDRFVGHTINIELNDVNGKKYLLKKDVFITSENKVQHLNVSDLPKGIYFINVITEDHNTYKTKLVKF